MHVELYAVRLALCGPGYVADIGAYLYRELSPLANDDSLNRARDMKGIQSFLYR